MKHVVAAAVLSSLSIGAAWAAQQPVAVGEPVNVDGYRVTLLAVVDLTAAERETKHGPAEGGKRLVWLPQRRRAVTELAVVVRAPAADQTAVRAEAAMLAGGGCRPWFSSASARACALPAESSSTSLLAADETGRSVALAGAVETRELERLVPIVLQGEGEGTPRVKT